MSDQDYPSVITGAHGPASKSLIEWMKEIFGKAFSVSRGFSGAHDGIDLPAKEGTPIYAISSGKVTYARDARKQEDKGLSGWAKYGGNVVNIAIDSRYTTQYAHLKNFVVSEGDYIKKGQLIGYVGRTGGFSDSPTSTFSGPHLHFGLWDTKTNTMINPQNFFESIGDTEFLGAWADQVKLPLGKILTQDDVDYIMKTLKENGWFSGDSVLGGTETKTREILESHIGDPWTKNLQNALQVEFGTAADAANDPLTAIGGQLVDTFTWIGIIIIGVVFIAGGLYLLGAMSQAKEVAGAATP